MPPQTEPVFPQDSLQGTNQPAWNNKVTFLYAIEQ